MAKRAWAIAPLVVVWISSGVAGVFFVRPFKLEFRTSADFVGGGYGLLPQAGKAYNYCVLSIDD
jgi:hypothetical protein